MPRYHDEFEHTRLYETTVPIVQKKLREFHAGFAPLFVSLSQE